MPDLDEGLAFYRDGLGHALIWRNDEIGQAGLRLPDGETEIVLSRHLPYAPNWLVSSVSEAATTARLAATDDGAFVTGAGLPKASRSRARNAKIVLGVAAGVVALVALTVVRRARR